MTLPLDKLAAGVWVADGAWSTQLRQRGCPPAAPAELANLERPQLVATLAREYLAAGAQFLCTNTFAANRLALAARAPQADIGALNRAGAELARQAAEQAAPPPRLPGTARAIVLGVIGPSGRILAVGEAKEPQLVEVFSEQARALAEGGVDALLLETFSELAEITIAIRAVKEATGLPVFASMSFDSGPQRTRTLMGAEAHGCAAALEGAGAEVVGCNCGTGIADVLPTVVAMRAATKRPLWVKPNAGLPELEEGRPVYRVSAEDFVDPAPTLLEAGATILGGCCGTGPEHIRRLAALVEARARAARRAS